MISAMRAPSDTSSAVSQPATSAGTCSTVRIQANGVASAMIIMMAPVVATVSTAAGHRAESGSSR